jgi:hypothetical protein
MTTEELRDRLARDFASAFIRIRSAHNPKPGEPCAWCRLAAEQAADAVIALRGSWAVWADLGMTDPSDCPKCGEWRDYPTADCAACGFQPGDPA